MPATPPPTPSTRDSTGQDDALTGRPLAGFRVPAVATALDLPAEGLDLPARLGARAEARLQGEAPFLVAPRVDVGSPAEANALIHEALRGGASALWLPLDAASRLALDPRSQAGEGAWADGGLMAYDLAAWRELLDGVHLEMITLLLEVGGQPLPCLAPLMALLKERGVNPAQLQANLGVDPYGSLAADGFFPGGHRWQERQLAEIIPWAEQSWPQARAFCLSAEPYHLAGASVVESLGLLTAGLVQLLHHADRLDIAPSRVARQVALRLPMGRDLFLHAAALRALRLLWRRVFLACGVSNPAPAWLHAIGSRRTLSRLDPWSNLLRGSTQAVAAALGGAEAITINPFDEADGKPGALGRRLARNTPQILAEECGLGDVFDPLAGSYWGEQATHQLAEQAWGVMQEALKQGGLINALGHGWVDARLKGSWLQREQALRHAEQGMVGVNRFPTPLPQGVSAAPRFSEVEAKAFAAWEARAAAWEAPADEDDLAGDAPQLMPFLAQLAASGADVFELAACARFAIHDGRTLAPVVALERHRDSEAFEALAAKGKRLLGKKSRFMIGVVALEDPRACAATLSFASTCASLMALPSRQLPLDEALAQAREHGLLFLCPAPQSTPAALLAAARRLQAQGASGLIAVAHPADAAASKAWQEANLILGLKPGDDLIAGLEQAFAHLQPHVQEVAR